MSVRVRFAAVAGLLLAVVAAYHNTLRAPFVFDDRKAILENPTIRHLASLEVWRTPDGGTGVSGRPLANLSLALNYAFGGLNPWGYHAVNLAIHLLATLTLFGIVRRTLARNENRAVSARVAEAAWLPSDHSALLAFLIALLWSVHPLLSESVTCVVQRNESLMGLFYLLTLYCFIRATEMEGESEARRLPPRSGSRLASVSDGWAILSLLACLCGMATKEVMATAPVLVFLYDRTFVSGSFREAWKRHRGLHLGLTATWLLLAALVASGGGSRGAAAGFGLGITPWSYALTQCGAIVHYLRLAFWPHPLVVDYGTGVVSSPGQVAPQALLLVLLGSATAVALWRAPRVGFLGAAFFLILAPSSTVVPLVGQTIAEHRMYLPLIAVVVLVVMGLRALMKRGVAAVCLALAVILVGVTRARNADYGSELGLWRQTVGAEPGNVRAHLNLGFTLAGMGRTAEAIAEYERALLQAPAYAEAHFDLGVACFSSGRTAEAIAEYERTLAVDPSYPRARGYLAAALARAGRLAEAIPDFAAALRAQPDDPDAESGLGLALLQSGRPDEAVGHLEAAVRLAPGDFGTRNNLGALYFQRGQTDRALEQLAAAVRLQPDNADAQGNLAGALATSGRVPEAVEHFRRVLRLRPGDADALNALRQLGAGP